ncbi:MAG: UDP-N-acetylmuramoyl-L-alanyl-D-glutamate--2,6-diaminopimelate ligase [Candidatus Microgenomates bacterium]|jgi:UDP-N-acetylmuramoyl-L-alanyl-D-glutamate--2,6-diaminopimelate ligase
MVKNIVELVRNIGAYKGVTADSRLVREGFIFVAVPGLTSDGHDFIPQAVKNGAKVVVGEKELRLSVNYIRVADSRDVLGTLASEFYGKPSQKLKIIGVTGTKGKTTTCYLIYHILIKLGKKVGLITSIAAKIGDKEINTGFHVTSPDVVSLHKLLAEMVELGSEFAIIEVSSHGIEQKRIAGIKFDVAVLTNIAPEHLDYHKTFGEYKRVKMSFINSIKNKVIAPKETNIDILPGKFNNLDVEAAIKAVEFFGVSRKDALESLHSFKLPEGRLTEIKNDLGIKIFIDFAHTPESLEAALKYLKTQTSGKLIAVFGSAGERDPYKRPKMGKVASEIADELILTAEDPRSEKAEDIIVQIKSGVTKKSVKIYEILDRNEAIKFAIESARKGDLVGIFGKGHEKSMNLDGTHEVPWSDRKIVEKYI